MISLQQVNLFIVVLMNGLDVDLADRLELRVERLIRLFELVYLDSRFIQLSVQTTEQSVGFVQVAFELGFVRFL